MRCNAVTPLSVALEGGVLTALGNCAKLAGVTISDTAKGGCMDTLAFHQMLLRVVWSLGASATVDPSALTALKVLSTQHAVQAWKVNRRADPKVLSPERVDAAVADDLQTNFLYILANLLLQDWKEQSQAYHEQSLRCFCVLIGLLNQSDVVKFLPKLLIVVDSAVGGTSARVRLAAIELVATLCPLLPAEALAANLSSLVVNLYPILESGLSVAVQEAARTGVDSLRTQYFASSSALTQLPLKVRAGGARSSVPAVVGAAAQSSSFQPTVTLPVDIVPFVKDLQWFGVCKKAATPAYVSRSTVPGLGGLLPQLLEASHAETLAKHWAAETKAKVVDIIRSLFLGRREDIQGQIHTVAYVPDIPELKAVVELHHGEVRAMTLEQSLLQLCEMLQHTSSHVRLVAVNRLTLLCRENKEQLNAVLEACSSDTTASSASEHVVSTVLQGLLRLSAKEGDSRVLSACARCFGEIGAIDPSRVSVSLHGAQQSVQVSAAGGGDRASQYPWKLDQKELCLTLLENHLVPLLRSADGSATQDKSGYAIQVILRRLAEALDIGPSATAVNESMPEALQDTLAARNILEVTEPFWSTSYSLSDSAPARSPPIYSAGMPFARWAANFSRYLIAQSRGPLSSVFSACRGVVRLSTELCQFLMPHLIYDVLVNSPFASTDGRVPLASSAHPLKCVILELARVLRGAGGSAGVKSESSPAGMAGLSVVRNGRQHAHSEQMCIQAVFALMDTLGAWVTRCVNKMSASYPRLSPYAPIAKYNPSTHSMDENGISRVQLLVHAIPMDLLARAAMDIRAYTRALRYLEIHTRRCHRFGASGRPVSEVLSGEAFPAVPTRPLPQTINIDADPGEKTGIWSPDRAGGMLPVLSTTQVDDLMTAFGSLEDPDSLQGALVMNHIYGHPSSVRHRILELELTDDWLGALLEYGLVHNSQQFSDSLHHYVQRAGRTSGVRPPAPLLFLAGASLPTLVRMPSNYSLASASSAADSKADYRGKAGGMAALAVDVTDSEGGDGDLLPLADLVELERRKMKCMVELGHFDAVIDQASALGGKLPEMEAALVPLGTEAAWRLMRWDDLDSFLGRYDTPAPSTANAGMAASSTRALGLPLLDADRFQLSVGKLLQCMKRQDRTTFDEELARSRIQTMSAISAASMESYGRAYPIIARLHALHELQCGFDLRQHTAATLPNSLASKDALLSALHWDSRLGFMSPSVPQRSTVLAVRRCILGICGLSDQVARNWLQLSDSMRRLGKFDAAHLAVRNAQSSGLDAESVLLQECRIYREKGEVSRALMLLEPVELDIAAINITMKSHRQGAVLPAYLGTEAKRKALAERIRLATQLMVDSKQKQGNAIVARCKAVIALEKHWMEAYFDLAKYYEFLYHDSRAKQAQTLADLQALLDAPASQLANPRGPSPVVVLQQQLQQDTQVLCTNLQQAVEMFGNCLILGSELATQVLPRMLTLWLAFTALQDNTVAVLPPEMQRSASNSNSVGNGANASRRTEAQSMLAAHQKRVNDSLMQICDTVPASTWYLCMSQIVSRVLHRNEDTVKVLVAILQKILAAYPKEGIWHMAGLMFSFNQDRKRIAKKLLQDTYKVLNTAKRVGDAAMLVDSQKVCSKLIELAGFQCKEKKIKWLMSPDVKLEAFLVPTQAVLHHTNPLRMLEVTTAEGGVNAGGAGAGANYYRSDRMYIAAFNESVDVASSKAKPKTITLRTVCGKTVRFLCKQEKDGDLRKDARMMEFVTAVNRLLQECPDGRKRHLRLRTFAVVCLNEECGILEWVEHTDCLRQLISKAHSFWPDLYANLPYKDVYQDILDLQSRHKDDLPRMNQSYAQIMNINQYRPCFHRWFLEQFPDPTAWQEVRTAFVRSTAVWSAVGHVIGLGDRHTENILLDVSSGEMVHVDFDCLFDKGLTLQRPEIVPFRLTPNIVDAMGVTGVEGAYRRTLEVTIGVLRENKDTLLSVLEPFLRDPTVSWSRTGRAQRSVEASAAATTAGAGSKTGGARDHENREAKDMLLKISQRLSGVYNLVHPHREKFVRAAAKRNEPPPARGIGASKEEMLPLSVPGQVQRLIDEATAPENLVQMYIGWQPWV